MIDSHLISLLHTFLDSLDSDPKLIHSNELSFFKEWLLNKGAKIDPVEVPLNRDDLEADFGESSESEIDKEEFMPEESVDDLEMGDESIEPTEEKIEEANKLKSEAQMKMEEGNYEEALKLFTEAIKAHPHSSLLYARRASCFIKMKKPSHAIKDCNKALSLNPNSASPHHWRGLAHKMLGHFEDAYHDLQMKLKLDYDDSVVAIVKEIEPRYLKIRQKKLDSQRKHEEQDLRARRERVERAREAQRQSREKAEHTNGNNEAGGADAFSNLMSDPDLMSAIQDPELMKALSEVISNPSAMEKYKDNPKFKKLFEKMMNKFGSGGGGIPGMGGMPFNMGSNPSMPNQCPDLD